MSDSSDRSQRLRDDESRSSDSSRAADSITNYFAPDEDEEVPVETLINSVPDILAIDIVPPAGRYDSIFNTSGEGMRGPGLGDRRRPEGEIVNARVGRDSRVANSSIWHNDARGPVGSGVVRLGTMDVGDLNPSDSNPGTTVTAATVREPDRNQPPLGGQVTRAEGFNSPRGIAGERTQNLLQFPAAGAPPERRRLGETASGLKSRIPWADKTRMKRHEERGSVEMDWEEESVDGREGRQLTTENLRELELAQLEEASAEAEVELEAALVKAREVSRARSNFFASEPDGRLADMRLKLSREYAEEGNLIKLLLADSKEHEAMRISPADFAEGLAMTWQADWELYCASKETSFGKEEVLTLMEKVTAMLPEWATSMASVVGDEAVEALMERHAILSSGLRGANGVTRAAAKLFPRQDAGDIMEWYLRFVSGLMELGRLKENLQRGVESVGDFLARYPGPVLKSAEKPRSTVGLGGLLESLGGGSRRLGQALSVASNQSKKSSRGQLHNMMTNQEAIVAAGEFGYRFRQQASPEPLGSDTVERNAKPVVRTLGKEFVRSKHGDDEGRKIDEPESDPPKGGVPSQDSVADTSGYEDTVPGFPGMDRQDISDEVEAYVTEGLEQLGLENELLIRCMVDNLPKLGLYTRKGYESSTTSAFVKIVKTITPYTSRAFISVTEWWKLLNQVGDDNGLSIPYRVRFLARTGGLAQKVNESYRTRVQGLMTNYKSWLPLYESTRDEEDHRYWLFLWMDVGLKLIQEFYTVQTTEMVEEGLKELFALEKYRFTSEDDPLNKDFFRVVLLYQDLNMWLTERSSDLVNSPLYIWQLLKDWLNEQGVTGKIMVDHIMKALAKLGSNPTSVLPEHHRLSPSAIKKIKSQGQGRATTETYGLVLERLKFEASQVNLDYTSRSLARLREIQNEAGGKSGETDLGGGWEKQRSEKKREQKATKQANSVGVDTDYSSLTLNTEVDRDGPGDKHRACSECMMFHEEIKGKGCPFWDSAKRIFKVKAFLNFRTVRQINADGSSEVNDFWKKKLEKWGFKGMGITREEDRKKVLKDLRDAAAAMPTASIEERRKYAAVNKRFMNLSMREENGGDQAVLMARLERLTKQVNSLKATPSTAPSKKAAAAKAKKQRKKERERSAEDEEESEGEAPDADYDDDDDDDDDVDEEVPYHR
jgi:hypothetical protein